MKAFPDRPSARKVLQLDRPRATSPDEDPRAIMGSGGAAVARKRGSAISRSATRPPSFARQIARHEASKFEPDAEKAMALFHALMIENARWDALRGVDPMERWRRDKEAQEEVSP